MTLEIVNLSGRVIIHTAGMPIAQLSFLRMSRPAAHPYGSRHAGSHYQGQTGPTLSAGVRLLAVSLPDRLRYLPRAWQRKNAEPAPNPTPQSLPSPLTFCKPASKPYLPGSWNRPSQCRPTPTTTPSSGMTATAGATTTSRPRPLTRARLQQLPNPPGISWGHNQAAYIREPTAARCRTKTPLKARKNWPALFTTSWPTPPAIPAAPTVSQPTPFDPHEYAEEGLVAEIITAPMLSYHDLQPLADNANSAVYVKSWRWKLGEHPEHLITAANNETADDLTC